MALPAAAPIDGSIFSPGGSNRGGWIDFELINGGGSVDSGAGVIGGHTRVPIQSDGTVDFALLPNRDELAGTYYRAKFYVNGQLVLVRRCDVPQASGVEVGSIIVGG